MKDIIDSFLTPLLRMLGARGLIQYSENACRVIVNQSIPTVPRKLKVIYTIEEEINIDLPAEPWTSSNRTLLVEQLLKKIQNAIQSKQLELYLCEDNKYICSLCNWYLEEFYSCPPCVDPCSNCDILPPPPCSTKDYSCK